MTHRLAATVSLGIFALFVLFAAQAQVSASQLRPEYQKWLKEDVRWIITDQERHDFMKLATDDQRDQFVVNFWERRNPTPGSKTNAFKEEHYRRLAFANEHFAANIPGWHTDRGRIYIEYGPPDRIETRPAVGSNGEDGQTSSFRNGIVTDSTHPYQVWHYNHMKGIGDDQNMKFIDVCSCGNYKLVD